MEMTRAGVGALNKFPPFMILFIIQCYKFAHCKLNIMFIFDKCHCSSAAVTLVRHECDSNHSIVMWAISGIFPEEDNKQSYSKYPPPQDHLARAGTEGIPAITTSISNPTLTCAPWTVHLIAHIKSWHQVNYDGVSCTTVTQSQWFLHQAPMLAERQ